MKKLFIIFVFILISSNNAFSTEKKCQGMKKLSKEFLACKTKSIKDGTINKSKKITGGVKNIGSKLIKPFKKVISSTVVVTVTGG